MPADAGAGARTEIRRRSDHDDTEQSIGAPEDVVDVLNLLANSIDLARAAVDEILTRVSGDAVVPAGRYSSGLGELEGSGTPVPGRAGHEPRLVDPSP